MKSMDTLKEIEFQQYVNTLRIKSLERKAVETDPWSADFDQIIDEIRHLGEENGRLMINAVQMNIRTCSKRWQQDTQETGKR